MAFRNNEVPLSNALCCGTATTRQSSGRLQVLAFIYLKPRLPQDFAKFFSGRCHIALCRTGDADGGYFRRNCEWTVEQAFASYEFQHRERQSDAASGLHFSDQRTHAIAFSREAWLGTNRGEHAVEEAIKFGVVLASETNQWLGR